MPRLDTVHLKIVTGQRGADKLPRYEINGFEIEFDETTGGCGPGETAELSGSPRSFPHSLALVGPEQGVWDIDYIEATYHDGDHSEPPYTIRLGAVTLDAETKLNLKHERPLRLLDV